MKHMKPGADFGPSDFSGSGFGFHGSTQTGPKARAAMPKAKAGTATPMPGTGRHGGGSPMRNGGPVNGSHIEAMHDSSELAHRGKAIKQAYAKGGAVKKDDDEAQDKKLVKKGVSQHETQEHGGKHSVLKLAKGGPVVADTKGREDKDLTQTGVKMARGGHVKMPGMHAKGGRRRAVPHRKPMASGPLNQSSAVNQAPADPSETTSDPNQTPGGQLPYGVQPSTEADPAGSGQGITQLKKGGKVEGYRRGGKASAHA